MLVNTAITARNALAFVRRHGQFGNLPRVNISKQLFIRPTPAPATRILLLFEKAVALLIPLARSGCLDSILYRDILPSGSVTFGVTIVFLVALWWRLSRPLKARSVPSLRRFAVRQIVCRASWASPS